MLETRPSILQRFFSNIFGSDDKETDSLHNENIEKTAESAEILYKLIDIALQNPKFIKTEGVLRLNANEVKKNIAIHHMDKYFNEVKQEPDFALLGTLIKIYLRASLTNEQKMSLFLSMGIDKTDIEIGFINKNKLKDLNGFLKDNPPKFSSDIPQLSHFICLAQHISANADVNKMTAANIAACISMDLLPQLGKMSTRAFEKNLCQLFEIVLIHWIKTAETGVLTGSILDQLDDLEN